MALSPSTFLYPVGHVTPAHFALTEREREQGVYADEDEKAAAAVAAWIAAAEAEHPDAEALQALRVHAVSRRAAYDYVSDNPASGRVDDEGSYSYTSAQIERMEAKATKAERAYADAASAGVVTSFRAPSASRVIAGGGTLS